MNICIVGKYPPIEGGVSTYTYWLAYGLAQRGHHVHVVTNANEVEDPYRMLLEVDDTSLYQPSFETSGGYVRVHMTEVFSRRTLDHIPLANPFVTKLAALATEVVRAHDCERLLGYYYEPYAVAASLAARWTRRPLLVRHAGSDLARLFGSPALATTYTEVLRSADVVLTWPPLMERFLGMGVAPSQLEHDVQYAVPTERFHPHVRPLDVRRLVMGGDADASAARLQTARPRIGIYGKIGETKGTYDLLAALEQLARQGVDFDLLAMIGEPQGRQVMAALKGTELEGRVHILPLLPNWKVPSFLRACSAVCVLERGFPVKMHGPIVPREVVACGVCLVLSKEIADKQDPRRFVPDQNVLVVDDPRDHAALAAVLRRVIEDPTWAQDIGARGVSAATSDLGFAKFAARWDSIIVDYDTRSPEAIEAAPRALDLMLPRLLMLFKTRAPDLLDEFLSAAAKGDVSPWRAGLDFCDFAANRSSRDARLGVELARLLAALRYQKARLIAGRDRDRDASASFVVTDQLQGSAVTPDLVSHLRPVRGSFVFVEEFDFDVLQLVTEPTNGNEGLELLRERRTLVLFARSPNSVVRELRIDDATRRLIDSCDGRHTTAELVQDLGSLFAVDRSVDAGGPADPVLRALDSLYRSKAVVFGEYRVGWGWTGGVRAKLVEPDGRIVLHHVDRKLPPSA